MKLLQILEKAWMVAAIAAIVTGIINLITTRQFGHSVYFAFICAGFCALIYYNVRGQRRFTEKMKAEGNMNQTDATSKS
jgi:predicted Co/Zn/Cd cation transporter (cation efflux family)